MVTRLKLDDGIQSVLLLHDVHAIHAHTPLEGSEEEDTYYLLEMSTRCLCSLGLPFEAWQMRSEARQLAQGLPLSQRICRVQALASL